MKLILLLLVSYIITFETESFDTEDLVFQMKGLFDQYADNLRNKMKSVDKIIQNNSTQYVENFSIEDFLKSSKGLQEDLEVILEANLKDLRTDNQHLDEKVLDYETKVKILRSRFTRMQTELNRVSGELNAKNHTMLLITNDIMNDLSQVNNYLTNSQNMIKNIKAYVSQYQQCKILINI
jgi:hypothetical protein